MSNKLEVRNVSRETWNQYESIIDSNRDQLLGYQQQLLWWNRKVNLVSRNADKALIWKHICHSLLPLALNILPSKLHTIDIGTGGGLPGIPLAIASPNYQYLLNDINLKKITAVRQIIDTLELENVTTHRGSFESIDLSQPFIFISKHSFKLQRLISSLSADTYCQQIILYKGSDYLTEYEELSHQPPGIAFKLDSHQSDAFFEDKYILQLFLNE